MKAATETLANALRLYRDAKLLFEHERFPSCASLSILAIEEMAKFMDLAGYQRLPPGKRRHHPAKHESSTSFVLRRRYQAILREVLAEAQDADTPEKFARL